MKTILLVLSFLAYSQAQTVVKINAGGGKLPDATADRFFSGGSTYVTGLSNLQNEYKDVRHGAFSYQIPVPNGRYQVKLHFAEVFTNFPGRTFNVIANDVPVLTGLNVFLEAGNNPLTKTFETEATNLDGLNLRFVPITRSAIVSAIEVTKVKPEEWCPGPILTRVDDKTFRVGVNWTQENPCHVQFAIQPATRPDPITVIRYTQPIDISLSNTVVSDNFYVYVPMPTVVYAGNGTSTTTVPPITILAANVANAGCVNADVSKCKVVVQPNFQIKAFPPNTSPLGTVLVQNGVIAPKINNIAGGERQITIGASAAMTVTERDGVLLYEINSGNVATQIAQRTAEQVANDLKVAQLRHEKWILDNRLPPLVELGNLRKNMEGLIAEINQLKAEMPASERELMKTTHEIRQIQQETQSMRYRGMMDHNMEYRSLSDNLEYRIRAAVQQEGINFARAIPMLVEVPKDPDQPCVFNHFAQDNSHRYACGPDGRWVRHTIDRNWKSQSVLAAQKEE